MRPVLCVVAAVTLMMASSCSRKEQAEAPKPAEETAEPVAQDSGPRVAVHLKDGSKVPGAIVASTRTEMVVAGEDGIERKIPLSQVKSVEYVESQAAQAKSVPPQQVDTPAQRAEAPAPARPKAIPAEEPRPVERAAAPARAVTTRTHQLPAGSQISVRVNEAINSETAGEGQTFDAQVTRDAVDENGDVVIPRGAEARVVIKSASKGGRFRGASDLVLDLQSVSINGRQYTLETSDLTKASKDGVGANRRTATYTGGGAAVGAIIGAIAGGGKGAAIGAGAGAGAGALAQVLTRGRTIKVPAESVLTFRLDGPLTVSGAR